MSAKPKTVLSLSGGLDSTVLLYYLLSRGHEVACISVNYGQRHRKELDCAANICEHLKVEHFIANMKHLKPILAGSSQTSDDIAVPEGHYAADSMKQTVVPNRNMILLSLAGAWAISRKADSIAYAVHAGDHTIYPDCRPGFVDVMRAAFQLCDWHSIKIETPFIKFTKANIVNLGAIGHVPFHRTWTCYKGGEISCGKCGTCVERIEAFKDAGHTDPLPYETDSTDEYLAKHGE